MNETTQHPSPERPEWETATELGTEAIAALRQPVGAAVAIVATVDADGAPRTAAFGSVRPITPTQLRFGCDRSHDTYANIVRDGRVMVAMFAPPNVAVGIRGRARKLKQQLDCWPSDAVIEIDIEAVKNDFLAIAPIATGITYQLPGDLAARLDNYMKEIETAAANPPAGR